MNEMKKGELFLSQPANFNDAFDSFSVLSSKNYLDYWKDPSTLRRSMKNHFSEDELSAIFDREDWREVYAKTTAERIAIENNIKINDVADVLNAAIMEQFIDLNNAFNNMVRMSRVACFTESYTNMPMWTHYTNEQQGICFEYDTSKLIEPFHIVRMFPALYLEKMLDVVCGLFQSGNKKPPFGFLDSITIQEHQDWSCEKEWRLICPVGAFYFNLMMYLLIMTNKE